MSSTTPTLHISASPLLAGFYLLIHGGAVVALTFSSLPPIAATLIASAVLVSAYINVRDQALRSTSAAIVELSLDENGYGRLRQRDHVCIEGLRLTGGANTSLVLCLSFRDVSGKGKPYHLNIARDAMHSEALRSLRMRLEHALSHGNGARS